MSATTLQIVSAMPPMDCLHCHQAFKRKSGVQKFCTKECEKAANREKNVGKTQARRARDPVRTAANNHKEVLKKYGLTPEDYDRMYRLQNGVCKVCRQPETRITKGKVCRLSVDHTGTFGQPDFRVRGLLCSQHNIGAGLFNHDPVLLRALADYLEKST